MRVKLGNSLVPLSFRDLPFDAAQLAQRLNQGFAVNDYMPGNTLGYLGYPKKDGCTRFVPVLTAEDTLIYYSLVWALEDDLIENIPGVYGAWHTKPAKVGWKQAAAEGAFDVYSSNTFNKDAWFKEWSSFSDLVSDAIGNQNIGNFILTSDIANFYDTIDINRLCDDIRNAATGQGEIVSLLRLFLQYWDRRVRGYNASSKGIPQDIISDASRTLANFYLRPFDIQFRALCASRNVTYVRWADDIILFGSSRKILEDTLHRGCRILLSIGLNFNASKTRHFTKKEYALYRGLAVLRQPETSTAAQYEKEIRRFLTAHQKNPARVDSVYRACITRLFNNPSYRTPFIVNFLDESTSDYLLSGSLDERGMFRLCAISTNPTKRLEQLVRLYSRYPYASVKATLMESLRKRRAAYIKCGIPISALKKAASQLTAASLDSEIIKSTCAPALAKVL